MKALNGILKILNRYPAAGNIEVVDDHLNDIPGYIDGDVAIYMDYDDHLLPDDKVDAFSSWYCDELPQRLCAAMAALGYRLVEDNDGSGGGLWYCLMVYRKVA